MECACVGVTGIVLSYSPGPQPVNILLLATQGSEMSMLLAPPAPYGATDFAWKPCRSSIATASSSIIIYRYSSHISSLWASHFASGMRSARDFEEFANRRNIFAIRYYQAQLRLIPRFWGRRVD